LFAVMQGIFSALAVKEVLEKLLIDSPDCLLGWIDFCFFANWLFGLYGR
jgi:hypothetical protein